MRKTISFPVAMLMALSSLASLVRAQEAAAIDPLRAVHALLDEHAASKEGHAAKFEQFRPRFEAMADEHRGHVAGLEAELWLLQGTWWSREKGTMHAEARARLARILETYISSKKLGEIFDRDYVFAPDDKRTLALRLIEESKHAAVRAAAHLSIGKATLRAKAPAPADADGSKHEDDGKTEGQRHLEVLVRDYAKLPYKATTYGALAEAYLTPHSAAVLEVGKPAPEIEGHGIDGKAMKLSDFRGKVVVLDFWGDW